MDTSKSERITRDYLQNERKYKRKIRKFSGTFDTTPERIFPLLCPAREADWIPGWNCELIYTKTGYAEDKCIFRTDKSNSAGEGLWTFTGFKLNEYIEFVKFQEDILMHCKISITQNQNGTTTASWNITSTALTENGNKEIDKMSKEDKSSKALFNMIDHYLKKGKKISKESLVWKTIHGQH